MAERPRARPTPDTFAQRRTFLPIRGEIRCPSRSTAAASTPPAFLAAALALAAVALVVAVGPSGGRLTLVTPGEAAGRQVAPPPAARRAQVALDALKSAAKSEVATLVSRETGHYSFVRAKGGGVLVADNAGGAAGASPDARALRFLAEHGGLVGIGEAERAALVAPAAGVKTAGARTKTQPGAAATATTATPSLRVAQVSAKDGAGQTHVRLDQFYRNLRVFGAQLVVHMTDEGVTAVNGNFLPDVNLDTRPAVKEADAARAALSAARKSARGGDAAAAVVKTELSVYRTGLLEGFRGENVLAYSVEVKGARLREQVWIDARDGKVLNVISLRPDAIDRTIYSPQYDPANPNLFVQRGEGGAPSVLPQVNNLYDFAGHTYNFYSSAFGRDSYDGAGRKMLSVYLINEVCPNAYWDGASTNYCPLFDADDVVSHEWSHAYTEYTHGLIYSYQSGALNESYSDIFGEAVDLLNNADGIGGSNNAQAYPAGQRWLVGEDLGAEVQELLLRDMNDPDRLGDPGKVSSENYACSADDGGGVHTNSGVPNHAFVLAVDGGTYNGQTVAGIGMTKASAVYFRAQSVYQTYSTNFAQHEQAVLTACNDLVGQPLNGLSTTTANGSPSGQSINASDCRQIEKAMLAVEMSAPPSCNFRPVLDGDAPQACPGAGDLFAEDWETGADGWTKTSTGVVPADWPGTNWELDATLPAGRAGSAAYAFDSRGGTCAAGGDISGQFTLDSPSITVPAGATKVHVRFDHYVATEATFDGGNVKISKDNGATWTLLPQSAYVFNAPGSQLLSAADGNTNPKAGEFAWHGADGGSLEGSWGTTDADLSSLVAPGDSFRIRFDFGQDGCNGVDGWYVDDVRVYNCPTLEAPALSLGADYENPDTNGSYTLQWTRPAGASGPDVLEESSSCAPLLADDAESGIGNWDLSGDGSQLFDWEVSNAKPQHDSNAFFARGAEQTNGSAVMTLDRPLSIPAGTTKLRFKDWYFNETDDRGLVEVSADNGLTWTAVLTNDRSGVADEATLAFADEPLAQREVDLSPYAGQSIKLRFKYVVGTSNFFAQTPLGWYVDDISVVNDSWAQIASAAGTSQLVAGRSTGTRCYRVRTTYTLGGQPAAGPSSNVVLATVAPGIGQNFNIVGVVTQAGTAGVPLSGVTLTLSGTRNDSVTTGALGLYSFTNLPGGGNYTVTPSRPGYTFSPVSRGVNSLAANVENANFAGAPAAPPASCALPGLRVLDDPTGDATTAQTKHDLDDVWISEVPTLGAQTLRDKLVFRVKVASLAAPLTPSTSWRVFFRTPDNVSYFVAMDTDAENAVSFIYGSDPFGAPLGTLDAASNYAPDGTITLVLDNTRVNVRAGQQLTNIYARTTLKLGGLLLSYPDSAPNADTVNSTASYLLVGNDFCNGNRAPSAVLNATPDTGAAPLVVSLDASASIDPDGAISSYTFDFGDGTPSVTGAAATVSHTYAAAGSYTARVTATDNGGESASATAVVVVSSGETPPRFLNYYAPTAQGLGTSAAEPTLGVNWKTGRVMYIANTQTLQVSFNECDTIWKDVTAPTTGDAAPTLDPILFVDPQTGRTFASQLAGKVSRMAFSDNDGGADGQAPGDWTPSQGAGINSGVDHQTVGGGPLAAPLTRDPAGSLYPNGVWYCSQDVAEAACALSLDGGLTFGPAVPIYTIAGPNGCQGLHGHVQVGADGAVYVPNNNCGNPGIPSGLGETQGVAVSTDNGMTWSLRKLGPSIAAAEGRSDPAVGVGSGGRVYFGYSNLLSPSVAPPYAAVSDDRGLTWKHAQRLGQEFGIKNAVFPSMTAGDNDRAAMIWFGTTGEGDLEGVDPATGASSFARFPHDWYVFISTTYDGGKTWTTVNVTPNDPVQRGPIWASGGGDQARNLLDFIDIVVDKEGRIVAGWADGCIGGCAADAANGNSYSDVAVITRQSGGKRLFAQYDPQEPARPSSVQITSATRDDDYVYLSWGEPDNGGTPVTNYKVFRRDVTQQDALLLANVGSNRSYVDVAAEDGKNYVYSIVAENAVGAGPRCLEVAPAAVVAAADPCGDPKGTLVVTDPSADAAPPALDIERVYLKEPNEAPGDRLRVTLKVANLNPATPNHQWYVIWDFGTGLRKYVAMKTNGAGAASYEYGEVSPPLDPLNPDPNANVPTKLGDADFGGFTPDGHITIEVAKGKIGSPAAGATITNISARTFAGTGNANVVSSSAADTTATPAYTFLGNDFCLPQNAPVASMTATPVSGSAPLTVNFDAAASDDPDAGDSVTTYTLNYGDTNVEEKTTPAFSHQYTQPGTYRAQLIVRDSRGKYSVNAMRIDITVLPAPAGISGTVTDGAGAPLPGVTVTLAGGSAAQAVTGGDGQYSFAGLAAGGNYTVTPAKDGYVFNPNVRTFNALGAAQPAANFVGHVPTPVGPGQIVISEFRLRGPDPDGAGALDGARDEFVELYNKSNADVTVGATDGSAGWLVAARSGAGAILAVATVPNGTVIRARGHLLVANDNAGQPGGYSLSAHAAPDAAYAGDIADDSGLAVFTTTDTAALAAGNLLDAAGFASSDALFREAAGMQPSGGVGEDAQFSFVRNLQTGTPADTGDNAADFVLVSTAGGTLSGVPTQLGAPGPQNAQSPINLNAKIKASLIDAGCNGQSNVASSACARVRVTCPTPGACDATQSFGTLEIRRKFTNSTGGNVTRLRFRVVDVTTLGSPGYSPDNGQADLRALTSVNATLNLSGGGAVAVRGLTLEEPPAQGSGGGFNSTLSAGTITTESPLAPGASVNVVFRLGVVKSGAFRFFINVEALP